jgi:hypothetical protein
MRRTNPNKPGLVRLTGNFTVVQHFKNEAAARRARKIDAIAAKLPPHIRDSFVQAQRAAETKTVRIQHGTVVP